MLEMVEFFYIWYIVYWYSLYFELVEVSVIYGINLNILFVVSV